MPDEDAKSESEEEATEVYSRDTHLRRAVPGPGLGLVPVGAAEQVGLPEAAPIGAEGEGTPGEVVEPAASLPLLRRGVKLTDAVALMAEDLTDDPKSYREAMASEKASDWKSAMESEYNSLIKNDTWSLVERPKGMPVIDCRWVYTIKRDEKGNPIKHKARFVAKGFRQVPGINVLDTWAPVTRPTSIRTVLSLAAMLDWECINMDVDTAFLYAPVEEEIYIKQPEGFEVRGPKGAELVCKLNKSLYGLKQAPRNGIR